MVENLARMLDNLWPESSLPPRDCLDHKEIDNKVTAFIDANYSEDHLKLLQVI